MGAKGKIPEGKRREVKKTTSLPLYTPPSVRTTTYY